ncbi:MAG: tetratricopeptide repeat protein, partial [Kofleriaceae bacterium]
SQHPDKRRRRWIAAAIAGAVGAGAIAAVMLLVPHGPTCGTGDDRIADVWNPSVRARLDHAFAASNRPHATASLDRLGALVDTWTGTWKSGYVEACYATRVRGDQSAHVMDLRMQCLTRRLEDTRTTLATLAAGGGDAVDHAFDAILALPSVAPCADQAGLTAAVAPPETDAARQGVSAVRTQLAAAKTERKLGRYKPGLATAQAALTAARATKYGPVIAEALVVVGQHQVDLADPASSATLAEAMHVATAAGDATTTIDAATWRMFDLTQRNSYDLAQEIRDLADATAQHARPPTDLAVRLDDTVGLLLAKRGQAKPAQVRYEAALALARRELGNDHPGTMSTLNQLGNLYKQQGKFADARKALEEVVASRERLVGKDHPDVASALNNLANVYRVEGKLDDAKQLYDRALAIRISALGPDHPEVATSYNNLGTFYSEKGDDATAKLQFEKALANWEKAYGKDSVEISSAVANLGQALIALGDHAGARIQFERAQKLIEAAHGPDHPDVAAVIGNLGVVALDERKYDEALRLYRRAEDIIEKAYGPDHPDVADYMLNITTVYKHMGKLREADEMTARTLRVIAKAYGADHPRMGGALVNYGALQIEQENYQGALETFQHALQIFEAKLGKDHPYVAFAASGIGTSLTELKRPAEAVPYEERALAIRIATHQPAQLTAEARFGLASALVFDPKSKARAIAEAKTALAEYTAADDPHDVEEVRAWLQKH